MGISEQILSLALLVNITFALAIQLSLSEPE